MPEADTALIARQLQQLGDLAEIGLEIARAVERRVKDAGPQDDLDPLASAYGRVARAVRLSILLQTKLLDARTLAEDRERSVRNRALDIGKARIERLVERAVLAEHGQDKAEVDRLMTETGDRLDFEDYGDILGRPVEEVVALICKDLGLEADDAARTWAPIRAASPASGRGGPRSGGEGAPPVPSPDKASGSAALDGFP